MSTPKVGAELRGSQSGRPIMAILDLLGRRWALRILWELHQHGPNSFRNLQKLCGDISPTVLNARLKELREAGIVELRDTEGYCITGQGVTLGKIIVQLNTWSKKWTERPTSVKASRHKKTSFPKSDHKNPKA